HPDLHSFPTRRSSDLRHEDCVAVSRNQDDFTSTQGVIMEDFPEVIVVASHSFLAMDDPEHNRLRSIVSRAFTARRTRLMEDWIRSEEHTSELQSPCNL